MNNSNLIPVSLTEIGGSAVRTVSARELHTFLEVGKDFTTWIKDRIEKYEFEEEVDYILTLAKIGERQNCFSPDLGKNNCEQVDGRGRPSTEYHITLDMAKELSMVENNQKGKEARKYFIQCEKVARGEQSMLTNDEIAELCDHNEAMTAELTDLKDKYMALMEKYIAKTENTACFPSHYNRQMTQEEHHEIARLYKAGLSSAEIQRKIKRSEYAVRTSLRKQNLV